MSDMKLPQGSDYHGDGKLFFKEDSYRGYPFNNLSLERWGKKWV